MKFRVFLTLWLLLLVVGTTTFGGQPEKQTAEKQLAKPQDAAAIIGQALQAGRAAMMEGDAAMNMKGYENAHYFYTYAINAYDEGLKVAPQQVSLLLNRAQALRRRGTVAMERAAVETDNEKQKLAREDAQKDLRAGIDATGKLLTGQAKKPLPSDVKEKQILQSQLQIARRLRADFYYHLVTKYDAKEADAALKAFQTLVVSDTDAKQKTQAQLRACKMLVEAKLFAKAELECQKTLTAQPESPEAKALLEQIAAQKK